MYAGIQHIETAVARNHSPNALSGYLFLTSCLHVVTSDALRCHQPCACNVHFSVTAFNLLHTAPTQGVIFLTPGLYIA
jgi:hypothetical protein